MTIVLLALFGANAGQPMDSLPLRFESQTELAGVRQRLESIDPRRLADTLALTGMESAGNEIRVVLATEGSAWARQVPMWTAGFALSSEGLIVLFPNRSPAYPHHSLEDVLRHEIAHVLIHRSSGGGQVPRWFHEGLALAAERTWSFDDRTRLVYQLVVGRRTRLEELDRLFSGDRNDQTRAYTLAGALVRDLMQRHGREAPAQVLLHMRRGMTFNTAYAEVAGVLPATSEFEFWQSQRFWTTWAPILTSSAALWALILLLALWAIQRRRQRDAAMERKWAEEDGE